MPCWFILFRIIDLEKEARQKISTIMEKTAILVSLTIGMLFNEIVLENIFHSNVLIRSDECQLRKYEGLRAKIYTVNQLNLAAGNFSFLVKFE